MVKINETYDAKPEFHPPSSYQQPPVAFHPHRMSSRRRLGTYFNPLLRFSPNNLTPWLLLILVTVVSSSLAVAVVWLCCPGPGVPLPPPFPMEKPLVKERPVIYSPRQFG